jgi:predicted nucleotidyltransferase
VTDTPLRVWRECVPAVRTPIYTAIPKILSIGVTAHLQTDEIRQLHERAAWIRDHFWVVRIGIFGSVARGEETPTSDIDILVEFAPGQATFQNFMGLITYLEDLFGRRVDLVTTRGIDPYLRPYIEGEVIWCEA